MFDAPPGSRCSLCPSTSRCSGGGLGGGESPRYGFALGTRAPGGSSLASLLTHPDASFGWQLARQQQQKLGLKDSLGWVQILTVSIISTYVLSGTQFILLHRTRIQHYSRYCASNYAILKEWSEERLVELLLKLFTLKSKKGNWLQIATCWPYVDHSDFIMLDVCNGLDKPSIRQAEVSGETYHMLGALSMKMPLGCTLKSSHFSNKNISWSQHECSSCSIAVCQSRHHMRLQIEPPETRNDDCVSLLQNWDLAFCSNSPLLKRLRWILLSGSVWTAVNHRCFGWDEGFKVWVVRSQYSSWTFERSMNCMNDRY